MSNEGVGRVSNRTECLDLPSIVGTSLHLAQCGIGLDRLYLCFDPSYSRGYITMFRCWRSLRYSGVNNMGGYCKNCRVGEGEV